MPRFRRAKHLTCFYCGKRSGLKFDGTVRDFLCSHCDATNFLDQNGEITDPPVATDREATAVQYAAPRSSSGAPSKQDDTFCQTCLKNQHLFTKSLAQYLPDDPSDPDYPELERNYYRYRRNLEKRYPQVCSECAERVEVRIRQAGYTAKTDHLRRMMNLSRGRKTKVRTKLDWVDALGKWSWRTGFVLQMLWHFAMITQALEEERDSGMRDPDDKSTAAMVISALARTNDYLPAADALMRWGIWTGLMAAWWNPHFVQVNRGFTRHLLGFTQWYSFQGLTLFFRFIFRGIDVRGQTARSGTAQLGAHVAMGLVMSVLYVLAGRSIRVDTTPLFATYNNQPRVPKDTKSPSQRKQEDSKTFSELFNDALESADATTRKANDTNMTPSPQSAFNAAMRPVVGPSTQGNTRLAETPNKRQQQPLQYDEEMDWSPITPQHRPLSGTAAPGPTPNKIGGFNAQAPPQPALMNPFQLKVPAAPVAPARRLRNPVWSPVAKQEPVETGKVMFTRRGPRPALGQGSHGSDASLASPGSREGIEFKQPRFFAPQQRDHDTNSLADMLNQSFSLVQEEDEQEPTAEQDGPPQDHHYRGAECNLQAARHPTGTPPFCLEQAILTLLLAVWLLTMYVPVPHGWEIQLSALSSAGVIALRGTGDAGRLLGDRTPASALLLYMFSAVRVAELAAICWVGAGLWEGRFEEVGWYGAGVLACVLGHEAMRGRG